MKLREKPGIRERKLKVAEVLNPELPAEASLNEQIGLSPKWELYLRSFLEHYFTDLAPLVNQLELAAELATLFPKEAQVFLDKARVGQVLAQLQEKEKNGFTLLDIKTLYVLSRFTPVPMFTLSASIEQGALDQLAGSKGSWWSKLEYAGWLIRLLPERKQEIQDAVEGQIKNLDTLRMGTEEWTMAARFALLIDPKLHPKLHALALNQQNEFEALFIKVKSLGARLKPKDLAAWFATYKLLLADEISVSPTEILLPVEKPRVAGVKPLPERSLAM